MKIVKSIQDLLGITAKRDAENRRRALAGQTTSGYLRAGERDRLIREAKAPKPKPRFFGTLWVTGRPLHPSNRPQRRWWQR